MIYMRVNWPLNRTIPEKDGKIPAKRHWREFAVAGKVQGRLVLAQAKRRSFGQTIYRVPLNGSPFLEVDEQYA